MKIIKISIKIKKIKGETNKYKKFSSKFPSFTFLKEKIPIDNCPSGKNIKTNPEINPLNFVGIFSIKFKYIKISSIPIKNPMKNLTNKVKMKFKLNKIRQ